MEHRVNAASTRSSSRCCGGGKKCSLSVALTAALQRKQQMQLHRELVQAYQYLWILQGARRALTRLWTVVVQVLQGKSQWSGDLVTLVG